MYLLLLLCRICLYISCISHILSTQNRNIKNLKNPNDFSHFPSISVLRSYLCSFFLSFLPRCSFPASSWKPSVSAFQLSRFCRCLGQCTSPLAIIVPYLVRSRVQEKGATEKTETKGPYAEGIAERQSSTMIQ